MVIHNDIRGSFSNMGRNRPTIKIVHNLEQILLSVEFVVIEL